MPRGGCWDFYGTTSMSGFFAWSISFFLFGPWSWSGVAFWVIIWIFMNDQFDKSNFILGPVRSNIRAHCWGCSLSRRRNPNNNNTNPKTSPLPIKAKTGTAVDRSRSPPIVSYGVEWFRLRHLIDYRVTPSSNFSSSNATFFSCKSLKLSLFWLWFSQWWSNNDDESDLSILNNRDDKSRHLSERIPLLHIHSFLLFYFQKSICDIGVLLICSICLDCFQVKALTFSFSFSFLV